MPSKLSSGAARRLARDFVEHRLHARAARVGEVELVPHACRRCRAHEDGCGVSGSPCLTRVRRRSLAASEHHPAQHAPLPLIPGLRGEAFPGPATGPAAGGAGATVRRRASPEGGDSRRSRARRASPFSHPLRTPLRYARSSAHSGEQRTRGTQWCTSACGTHTAVTPAAARRRCTSDSSPMPTSVPGPRRSSKPPDAAEIAGKRGPVEAEKERLGRQLRLVGTPAASRRRKKGGQPFRRRRFVVGLDRPAEEASRPRRARGRRVRPRAPPAPAGHRHRGR